MPLACNACLSLFFNDSPTTDIYTLSLHDALPIFVEAGKLIGLITIKDILQADRNPQAIKDGKGRLRVGAAVGPGRSEEHTSELQSRQYLVCRLLLEKKNKITTILYNKSLQYQELT